MLKPKAINLKITQPAIIIGSDHAGFKLKLSIKSYLSGLGYKYEDVGAFSEEASDYPKTALEVAKKVAKAKSMGILLCGTGIGESIVANKIKGIMAANCFNEYTAQKSREHNNSNVLCLGARLLSEGMTKKITKIWLETKFSTEPRHRRRVNQIREIESNSFK